MVPTATVTPPRPTVVPCLDPPCPYLQPTRTPASAWPPPAVTCTPGIGTPTLTPPPTAVPRYWPDRNRQPAGPAVFGNTRPIVLEAGLGVARPGSFSVDPRSGRPWISYSRLNPDPGQEDSGRIYVRTVDAAVGVWRDAVTVNEPGYYRLRGAPESAVAAGGDGRIHVVYPRRRSVDGDAVVEYRVSTDEGRTWRAPVALPGPGAPLIDNLRLTVDAANAVHIAFVTAGTSAPAVIHYFEQRPDGSWRVEIPPVGSPTGRAYAAEILTFPLVDGTIRTVLGWIEAPPDRAGAVYTAWKDGPAGGWSCPLLLIDGAAQPYGLPDYAPQGLRGLTFTDAAGQRWTQFWWSIYSTGRICFAASADGGQTWGPTTPEGWHEDAIVYYDRLRQLTPGPNERSRGTAHDPAPFWDAPHQRVVVLYLYGDKRDRLAGGQADSFPAFAYGRPGAPGTSWQGYATFRTTPWRLTRTTYSDQAEQLLAATAPDTNGYIWAGWVERDSADKFYGVLINPASLIGDGDVRP